MPIRRLLGKQTDMPKGCRTNRHPERTAINRQIARPRCVMLPRLAIEIEIGVRLLPTCRHTSVTRLSGGRWSIDEIAGKGLELATTAKIDQLVAIVGQQTDSAL